MDVARVSEGATWVVGVAAGFGPRPAPADGDLTYVSAGCRGGGDSAPVSPTLEVP